MMGYPIFPRFLSLMLPAINSSFLSVIPIITLSRIWLFNYDRNCSLIQSKSKWQTLLGITMETDWYSHHKQKWGNWLQITKVAAVCWMMLSLLFVLTVIVTPSNWTEIEYKYVFTVILCVCILIPSTVIWHRIPSFKDPFFVQKELSLLIRCDLTISMLWILLIFWSDDNDIFFVLQLFLEILLNLTQIAISHYWVLQRLSGDFVDDNWIKTKMKIIRTSILSLHSSASQEAHPKYIHDKKVFQMMVSSEVGIHYLFNHLLSEFTSGMVSGGVFG